MCDSQLRFATPSPTHELLLYFFPFLSKQPLEKVGLDEKEMEERRAVFCRRGLL